MVGTTPLASPRGWQTPLVWHHLLFTCKVTRPVTSGKGCHAIALARCSTAELGGRRAELLAVHIPLLHAGAGNLTSRAEQAWRKRPTLGTRFGELEVVLRARGPAGGTNLYRSVFARDCGV